MQESPEPPVETRRASRWGGLIGAAIDGYFDLADSTVLCLERRPKSIELYGWIVLAGTITCLGWLPGLFWIERHSPAVSEFELEAITVETLAVLASIAFVLIIFPLYTLLTGLLVHPIVRYLFDGRSGLRVTMVATAWASLLIAPVSMLFGVAFLLQNVALPAAASNNAITVLYTAVGAVFMMRIWARCLTGAHSLGWPVLLYVLLVFVELWLALINYLIEQS